MSRCEHSERAAQLMGAALLAGNLPSWRHLRAGAMTPAPNQPRGYKGSRNRAILYLGMLFLVQCWDPDQSYANTLLTALGVWLAVVLFGFVLYGWSLSLGADPICDCEDRP